jgi:CHAT domain-containing protein
MASPFAAPRGTRTCWLEAAAASSGAMTSALDDSGRALFDYAHPLFWAPYTIIGDGG